MNNISKRDCFKVSVMCILAAAAMNSLPGELQASQSKDNKLFHPTVESLSNYECPEWFRDAKFGIYCHWNGYAASKSDRNGWYARDMYLEDKPAYNDHLENWGHPSEVGYKDVLKAWNADKFDAEEWVKLFKDAGAKYIVTVAVHHDNFHMWDSKYQPKWNSMNYGPKKDVCGEMRKATLKAGLRWGVTTHAERTYSWFQSNKGSDSKGPKKGVPYDGNDPAYKDLYLEYPDFEKLGSRDSQLRHPLVSPQSWKDYWKNSMFDLIDRYHPDHFYFDGAVPFMDDNGKTGLEVIAHYYNHNASRHNGVNEGVMVIKHSTRHGIYYPGISSVVMERESSPQIEPFPRSTENSVGPWFNSGSSEKYRSFKSLLHEMIDSVSKNNNYMLNIPPKGDGSIDEASKEILKNFGKWFAVNGEAIYETRPWHEFGEGAVRFTTRDKTLYAISLGLPEKLLVLSSTMKWGKDDISSVKLLGYNGDIDWKRQAGGYLEITLPDNSAASDAHVFKINCKKPVNELSAVRSRPFVAVGCKVEASSVYDNNPNYGPDKVLDNNETTRWAADRGKRTAWLTVDLGKQRELDSVYIAERGNRVTNFELQIKKRTDWQTVLSGTRLGANYQRTFEPVVAQHVRLNILSAEDSPTIWEFNLSEVDENVKATRDANRKAAEQYGADGDGGIPLIKRAVCTAESPAPAAAAGGLSFGDPANVASLSAGAIGFSHRQEDFDVAPGFQNPPLGYGTVMFYWWLGDPLTKERLSWQLEQMKGMGVSGYQINYAHSTKGGRSYGLTYPSDPVLFSEQWWDLTGWFMAEAKKQGAAVSLSDYTLGFGQGWCVDKILQEHPDTLGMKLRMTPEGEIRPETVPWSFNPMHPQSGKLYADEFFGQFEQHFPGEAGQGLNFFFSDELSFGVDGRGQLWSPQFAEEFRRRKGYDIMLEIAALFKDIGPRTPKIRLDYSDVKVALMEEGFFKPVFDWHQQRGMIIGCDHGGRGKRVNEFGDYFRTQRWNQGPGSDQPRLRKDLIKAKVASSIAHLYERPRVWLEGFYSSGWGTTSESVIDATLANYAMGYNMLGVHGMYYSTHGGWWEWAPPDNTFRMPYWKHLRGFMDCQQRLAYLLSQGYHMCDVAILYPVAPVEAGLGGDEAVKAAFDTAKQIYGKGIDFDFMDFESLARAKVIGKELQVSGEGYRVLILPGMRAVRHSTLLKAVEFRRAGGIVLAVGALPEASDRIGRDDPEVEAMVRELFPEGLTGDVASAIPYRDYNGPGYILHRRIGPRDMYTVYNAPKGQEVFFRAGGQVELWDPWTGKVRPLAVTAQDANGTHLKLPLGEKEIQLIVFNPGKAIPSKGDTITAASEIIPLDGSWEFELEPTLDNRFGDFHLPPTPTKIAAEARRLKYADEKTPDCGWQDPKLDDSSWSTQTCGFGPRFWKLGPLPDGAQADLVLAKLEGVEPNQPVQIAGQTYRWQPYEFSWRYGIENDCSQQGYHGLKARIADEFIGLGQVKHVLTACRRMPETGGTRYYLWTTVRAAKDGEVPVSSTGLLPSAAWLNGERLDTDAHSAALKEGSNPLLLRYDNVGRGSFVFGVSPESSDTSTEKMGLPWNTNLTMRWYNERGRLPFDTRPQVKQPAGWYRFTSPPSLKRLTIPTRGQVRAWAEGKELPVQVKGELVTVGVPQPSAKPVVVALRVEQQRGEYGGAAFSDYIRLDCGQGEISLGDWSKMGVLETYSGGGWYRKTFQLTPAQAKGNVTLDLGRVASSAEVLVNGKPAGIRVAPPWRVDLTSLVREGEKPHRDPRVQYSGEPLCHDSNPLPRINGVGADGTGSIRNRGIMLYLLSFNWLRSDVW